MEYENRVKDYIAKEIEILSALDTGAIDEALNEIEKVYNAGGKIYIMGNGGSSATASHYANDFNKGLSEFLDKKFEFVCLCDNVPTLMAITNDIGFEEVFRFQLKGRLKKGDLVIGISGSGNSKNVLNAIEYAKSMGVKTIGMTGYNGGKLKDMCDVSMHVPVDSMQITEDIHMIFDHLMMTVIMQAWNIKTRC